MRIASTLDENGKCSRTFTRHNKDRVHSFNLRPGYIDERHPIAPQSVLSASRIHWGVWDLSYKCCPGRNKTRPTGWSIATTSVVLVSNAQATDNRRPATTLTVFFVHSNIHSAINVFDLAHTISHVKSLVSIVRLTYRFGKEISLRAQCLQVISHLTWKRWSIYCWSSFRETCMTILFHVSWLL